MASELEIYKKNFLKFHEMWYLQQWGHAVTQLVEKLHFKPEGHGFNSRWCHWIFFRHNPSGRTLALGLTQPLTEMSTWNVSCG
jgi:hypothetical protein